MLFFTRSSLPRSSGQWNMLFSLYSEVVFSFLASFTVDGLLLALTMKNFKGVINRNFVVACCHWIEKNEVSILRSTLVRCMLYAITIVSLQKSFCFWRLSRYFFPEENSFSRNVLIKLNLKVRWHRRHALTISALWSEYCYSSQFRLSYQCHVRFDSFAQCLWIMSVAIFWRFHSYFEIAMLVISFQFHYEKISW